MGAHHFYTTDPNERAFAMNTPAAKAAVFRDEGTACYVFPTWNAGPVPFFRARNSVTGSHFYTTSMADRDAAIKGLGYIGEGIACYILG
jgi:hypothetical protein